MKESAFITNFIRTVAILSVSPIYEDHGSLKNILSKHLGLPGGRNANWQLYIRPTFESAVTVLRGNRVSVVVCECDLRPGSWKDIMDETALVPGAPPLIVTSRLADERLWAEALNLGAYDVLAKPFDPDEVTRVFDSAQRHWQDQQGAPAAHRSYRAAS